MKIYYVKVRAVGADGVFNPERDDIHLAVFLNPDDALRCRELVEATRTMARACPDVRVEMEESE